MGKKIFWRKKTLRHRHCLSLPVIFSSRLHSPVFTNKKSLGNEGNILKSIRQPNVIEMILFTSHYVHVVIQFCCHSIPFHSIPFHSIPFHSIPFHSISNHSLSIHFIAILHTIAYHYISLYTIVTIPYNFISLHTI